MQVTAHWTKWTEWEQYSQSQERLRELKIGPATIASHRQIRTEDGHLWGKGLFHSVRIGDERSTPAFRTQRAALRRLRAFG